MQDAAPEQNRKNTSLWCCVHAYLQPISFILLFTLSANSSAAPPFLSDDAEVTNAHQLQLYIFSTINAASHTTFYQAPALEADYGLIPHLETHILIPITTYVPVTNYIANQGRKNSGLGDIEIGIKYEFLTETAGIPAISMAPTLELPTGNVQRFLGNGRLWSKLPLWLEKHWGKWLATGGGGYVFNSAPNYKNYLYGGAVLQRELNQDLLLGAEIFSQGATTKSPRNAPLQDTGKVTFLNLGVSYNMNSNLALLFSVGHSVLGTKQWATYLGLYLNLYT